MALLDFMNTNHYKSEAERLSSELEQLKSTFTPEMRNATTLQSLTLSLQREKQQLEAMIQRLNSEIVSKKRIVIELDEAVLLQEFGLYEPKYEFSNASKYQAELEKIRKSQKDMIKLGRGATGNMGWTVNNDNKKGKKMVTDMQKLLLRAFNSECDELIAKLGTD